MLCHILTLHMLQVLVLKQPDQAILTRQSTAQAQQWLPATFYWAAGEAVVVSYNECATGAGPETARSGHIARPEHSAGSAVDAGHLDMGSLRSNSTTLPQSSASSASAPRRATVEMASAPAYRVNLQP